MTTTEFLAAIVARLDDAGIPHMVAGSVASSHHGEPRSTQDIDLVIDPSADQLAHFVDGLDPARFYASNALVALANRSMFNVIEPSTGFKADLILRKDRPFSTSEFRRRQPVVILGVRTAVATVEDTMLAKLEWSDAGKSDRQLHDVAAMIRVHGDALDLGYLRRWASDLNVRVLLEAALADAGLR